MSNPLVRIGFLGIAHMHSVSYAHSLLAMPGVEVVGMWDRHDDLAADWSARLDVARFASADALLAAGLDAVVVCSENAYHRPLVEQAAGRVKAILCEKPIATTVTDAQAMIDRCAATNTQLQIAFPVRFAPSVVELKRHLDAGLLGEILTVNCTNHGSMPGGWITPSTLSTCCAGSGAPK
jgi:predicted dehydrogenase